MRREMRRDKKWADLCVALVVGLHLVAVQISKQLRLGDLLEVVRHICAEYNGQNHLAALRPLRSRQIREYVGGSFTQHFVQHHAVHVL